MQALNRALKSLNIELSAAEFHGSLIGVLVGRTKAEDWLIELIGKKESNNVTARESVQFLIEFVSQNQKSLNSANFKFDILIANEDHSMTQRLQDLSHWCQGFLYTFALSGTKLNSEMNNIIADFTEFTRVDYSTANDQENESALIEIIEYIKIGVLLINEETANKDA